MAEPSVRADKGWALRDADPAAVAALTETGYSPVLAALLVNRGITSTAQAEAYFSASVADLFDPLLLKGMKKAAARVRAAIEAREKITVYGDYDVDGVTATTLLFLFLQGKGAHVASYIPEREGEGYGLNEAAMRRIAADGTRLIVTVDTGISALKEAALARALGMDLVITDHHEPRDELPDAFALVDPKQPGCTAPFRDLAGVGVAFKLVCAVEETHTQRQMLMRWGDLVCLGTVADVVPLTGENRALVKMGLNLVVSGKNPGIKALCAAAGVTPARITASTLSFTLAPRINACGRMGSALTALSLLTAKDPAEAARLAAELDRLNRLRQETEKGILVQALEKIRENPSLLTPRILVVSGEKWHNGVTGIVASRLLERFGRPCILVSFDEEGIGRASCRSVPGFDIFKALSACSELLLKYGGHPMAAGFSIQRENFGAFCERLFAFADTQPTPEPPALMLDCALAPADLTLDLAHDISRLEPCGNGNPAPMFLLRGAFVKEAAPLSEGKHYRLSLDVGGTPLTGLLFGAAKFSYTPRAGDLLDLAAALSADSFRGVESLSAIVRGVAPRSEAERQRALYAQFAAGALTGPIRAEYFPARADFAAVYRDFQAREGTCFRLEDLLGELAPAGLNYFKLRLITDVFRETELIEMTDDAAGCRVCIRKGVRVDLGRSELLKKLKVENEVRHG